MPTFLNNIRNTVERYLTISDMEISEENIKIILYKKMSLKIKIQYATIIL